MSKIEVNTVAPQCGTTLTLGESGDTVTLGSGASQSGFGRTGTVDWDVTPKTASFTADTGDGYFVNTTSGAITVTLPAGTANAIISLADYAGTWQTNNVTVTPNGTDKIGGVNENATLDTQGQSVTFVFVDSTQGWVNVQDSTSNVRGASFITATGGTITTCGNCKIHTFTGPGTFTVCSVSGNSSNNKVGYLVVAGGGGGGASLPGNTGAGGGAGGFREGRCNSVTPYPNSPLGDSGLTVTATSFPITVGGGGTTTTPDSNKGGDGNNSIFSTITSTGGGGGGSNASRPGSPGGSGGGGSGGDYNQPGGNGNTPPVSPSQGSPGGNSTPNPSSPPDAGSGGGGGATEAGVNATNPGTASGRGGAGATTSISASSTAYAGGGGGGSGPGAPTNGAASPCGTGGAGAGSGSANNGTDNTGGGGGGVGGGPLAGGLGGSGIVIIRYKFQ